VVLFDGSPLSPAPLNPHHATISASLLSARRDMLFVVLYEFWQVSCFQPFLLLFARVSLLHCILGISYQDLYATCSHVFSCCLYLCLFCRSMLTRL